MRHWSQLATRNWRVRRVRTAGAVLAIALGTGAVVWVTCCYESVRRTVLEWAASYVGAAQITIQSPLGRFDTLPQRIQKSVEQVNGVTHVAPLLVQRLPAALLHGRAAAAIGDSRPAPWVGGSWTCTASTWTTAAHLTALSPIWPKRCSTASAATPRSRPPAPV